MSSLYDRLNLTKPNRRKLQVLSPNPKPIWERIDLTRPEKLKCQVCRDRIQAAWRVCPNCGNQLQQKLKKRHCVWIQVCNLNFTGDELEFWQRIILPDAFSKVFSAFRGINIFLTTEPPQNSERATCVYVLVDESEVDYLGIASFRLGSVTDKAVVRIDQICHACNRVNLSVNELSNLVANIIVHEIGHTLGLDHSNLNTDIMHDGLDYTVHSLMPPSFHGEQITMMNYAISNYLAGR